MTVLELFAWSVCKLYPSHECNYFMCVCFWYYMYSEPTENVFISLHAFVTCETGSKVYFAYFLWLVGPGYPKAQV